MKFKRCLDLISPLKKKSQFLFGPRSSGKTFLIKESHNEKIKYINLLNSDEYFKLANRPSILRDMCEGYKHVVIDEIQKLPILLDEVHFLIEEKYIKFLLTGSSARRLKREHANMLGGRAGTLQLYPLCSKEIENFNLEKYLNRGGLPRIYNCDDVEIEFEAYLHNYLEQEIQIESNIRNLQPFSRFLKCAALSNGQLINYQNIASDVGLSAVTIREYYQILEDTLLGFKLDPWLESKKRKAIQTSKFYLFDIGVVNYICDRKHVEPSSKEWGDAFEQFIIMEIKAFIMYFQKRHKLSFWRNQSKHEVDVIIDSTIGIEIKSTDNILPKHLTGLKALMEESITKKHIVVSFDPIERVENGIEILFWKKFLDKLWAGKIL
jgi:predicted AAA+ superfamily ATPase